MRQIDEIYTLAKAMEAACQAAAAMASEAGASNLELENAASEAHSRAQQEAGDLSPVGSPLGEAQRSLVHRREMCRALSRLALEHGVDHRDLEEQLVRVTEVAASLYHASTLSDLGFRV